MSKVWKVWWVSLLVTVVCGVAGGVLAATVPMELNYQGTLTDGSGTPLTSSQTITFRLHAEAASAVENAFWAEQQSNVALDDNGHFSVTLGADTSGNPINKDDFDGETYIGIQIGTDLELMPRQKLTAVAYAMRAGDGVPVGTILEFAGTSAPGGYLLCQGGEVSRATYSALFAVIDTIYGAGDGTTTFNVPDKRNRTSFGAGDSYTLGDTIGNATVNLSHIHPVNPPNTNTNSAGAHNHTYSGTTSGPSTLDNVNSTDSEMIAHNNHTHSYNGTTSLRSAHSHSVDIGSFNSGSGGSATQSIINPGLATNFIIKY